MNDAMTRKMRISLELICCTVPYLVDSLVDGAQGLSLQAPDNVVLVLAILIHSLDDTEFRAEPARLRGGGGQRGKHRGHDHDSNVRSTEHFRGLFCYVSSGFFRYPCARTHRTHTAGVIQGGRERRHYRTTWCDAAPGTKL